jgi:hypothetical protein
MGVFWVLYLVEEVENTLSEWLFLGEQSEDGVVFQCGQAADGLALYHWERLNGRPGSADLNWLRSEAERRALVHPVPPDGAGILPVAGPLAYQERYWLGWPLRRSRPLDRAAERLADPESLLRGVQALIRDYARLHRAGLAVGRPDWRRLRYDGRAVAMPDPWFQEHLVRPELELPQGLAECRPPEEYRSGGSGTAGDRYYLGLIIYWFWTGRLPYELRRGWPTAALRKGELIPPEVFRPGIPAEASRLVLALLGPDPERRPGTDEVESVWEELLARRAVLPASPAGVEERERTVVRGYRRRCLARRAGRVLAPALGGILALGALSLWLAGGERPLADPQGIARQFYDQSRRPVAAATAGEAERWSRDFRRAWQRRMALAEAVALAPVADLEGLRLLSRDDSRAVVAVRLRWREFTEEGWRFRRSLERLTLERRGKGWKIAGREEMRE